MFLNIFMTGRIKQLLENLASGNVASDPHSNIKRYMASVEDPEKEIDKLAGLLERLVSEKLSPEEYEILNSDTKKMEKLNILTKLAMKIPFDYIGNAIKTAEFMKKGDVPSLEKTLLENKKFYYLRTPTEVLEGYFDSGSGGDCFSTTFLTQILFSLYGIESRMALCYDKKEDSSKPEKRYHCVVLAKCDEKDFYVDTSLNIEIPVEFGKERYDSGKKSSIFRLIIEEDREEDGKYYRVSYMPEASPRQGLMQWIKTLGRNVLKGPVHLWYFHYDGNCLDEILPSMLYTLHPETPPNKGNSLNRNQQLRISSLFFDGSRLIRERIFYHEAKKSYLSRITIDRLQREKYLGVSHDEKTGIIRDQDKLVNYINKRFGIKAEVLHKAIESLNYINSNVRK